MLIRRFEVRTTVSSRGQTAVPAEVRRRFHLGKHSGLEWLIDGEAITVLPVPPDPARAFRGSLKGKYSGPALLRARKLERKQERDVG
jgi:bifunctional DNA-binding transcriptional regulator/antitoxin component of YhaV-PrlF toxin-antitoxin module